METEKAVTVLPLEAVTLYYEGRGSADEKILKDILGRGHFYETERRLASSVLRKNGYTLYIIG